MKNKIVSLLILTIILTMMNVQQSPQSAQAQGYRSEHSQQAGINERFIQAAYLRGSNTEGFDLFGYALAIDGDTLVIGAMNEDSSATGINGDQNNNSAEDSGAVYVFVYDGSAWNQQAYLKASNTDGLDYFGTSVAISGDTLVVGAIGESEHLLNGERRPG